MGASASPSNTEREESCSLYSVLVILFNEESIYRVVSLSVSLLKWSPLPLFF